MFNQFNTGYQSQKQKLNEMQNKFIIKEVYDLNTTEQYWCKSIKFNTSNTNFCCLFETHTINDLMLFSLNPLKFLAQIQLKNQLISFFTLMNKSISLILGLNNGQIYIYRLKNGKLENEQIIELSLQEIKQIIINQEDMQFFVTQPFQISCFYYDNQQLQWIFYQYLNKQEKQIEQSILADHLTKLQDPINKNFYISLNSSENQLIINYQNYYSLYQQQGQKKWKLMSHRKIIGQYYFLNDNIQLILDTFKLTILQVNFRRKALIRSFHLRLNHFLSNNEFQFDREQKILIFNYDNYSLGIVTILKHDQFCQLKTLNIYENFVKKSISSNLQTMVTYAFEEPLQIKVLIQEDNQSKEE